MAKKKPQSDNRNKSTASKAAGKPGFPQEGQRKIVPDDYDTMAKLWGTGCSFRSMAKRYGVTVSTIRHHFKAHIFPMIQASSTRTLEAELLKITELERVAWKCFYSTDPAERREVVKNEVAKLKEKPEGVQASLQALLEKSLTTVHKTHQKAWLEIVQWCIDTRLKIEGHYAAVKVRVQHEEYRVAGASPVDHLEQVKQRIVERVDERRAYHSRLAEIGYNVERN